MYKYLAIALVALTAAFTAETAMAQARLPVYTPDVGGPVVAPKAPRVPKTQILPPSAAMKQALRQVPGAQPLIVRPKGDGYIVKLKKGGNIIQFNVNSATGAVTRLP